jgi:hypothetical protein
VKKISSAPLFSITYIVSFLSLSTMRRVSLAYGIPVCLRITDEALSIVVQTRAVNLVCTLQTLLVVRNLLID